MNPLDDLLAAARPVPDISPDCLSNGRAALNRVLSAGLAASAAQGGRRAIRVRRWIPTAAAALTAAAGMAVAVTSLAAPGHPPAVRLAAWTVVSKPGGAVQVTIRELRDPAGLEHRLRADGVPASVTYYRQPNPSCRPYSIGIRRYERVFPLPQLVPGRLVPVSAAGQSIPGRKAQPGYLILIRTAALPQGAGIQLAATVRHGHIVIRQPKLVQAQPSCTGS